MIEVKNLGYSYKEGQPILSNINFQLNPGEFMGVLGPNGGGKSTLLQLVVGLLKAPKKSISNSFQGKIGYVPQQVKLNHTLPLSLRELVSLGQMIDVEDHAIDQALSQVSLKKDLNTDVRELSGGEKQRALLAKTILSRPSLLVLDEPTTGLDSDGQDKLLSLIQNIISELKTSVIMVDHNIHQVLKHCDKLLCLNRTQHWHDKKEFLEKNILEDIYHCEFEHLKLHDQNGVGDHLSHGHPADQCSHSGGKKGDE